MVGLLLLCAMTPVFCLSPWTVSHPTNPSIKYFLSSTLKNSDNPEIFQHSLMAPGSSDLSVLLQKATMASLGCQGQKEIRAVLEDGHGQGGGWRHYRVISATQAKHRNRDFISISQGFVMFPITGPVSLYRSKLHSLLQCVLLTGV